MWLNLGRCTGEQYSRTKEYYGRKSTFDVNYGYSLVEIRKNYSREISRVYSVEMEVVILVNIDVTR